MIEGPPDAQDGDYLYLSLEQLDLESVEASISINSNPLEMTEKFTCEIQAGDTLIARHPDVIYVSF